MAAISEEGMPRMFTRFEQTEAACGRTDSTGLGLPVSRGMADEMGRRITATSTGSGHGSMFGLVLEAGTGEAPELRMASLSGMIARAGHPAPSDPCLPAERRRVGT